MTPAGASPGLSLAAVRLSGVDPGLEHLLDDAELARANTFRSPALRNRFVAGRIALRLHISSLTGDSADSLKANYFCPSCRNRTGKSHGIPSYHVPSRPAPLRSSLSRSGDWCLLAVSLNDAVAGIGVDIEAKPDAIFYGFQSLALTAREREKIQQVPPRLRAKIQTRLWVRKEAALKALGTGLAMDPTLIDVSEPIPAILRDPPPPGVWKLKDISPASIGLPHDVTASVAVLQLGGEYRVSGC